VLDLSGNIVWLTTHPLAALAVRPPLQFWRT